MADPLFANVTLLLHCDGADGTTTIVDSSTSAKSFAAFGNAQISTAQSKFGGASILLDGAGDFFSCDGSADFAFPDDFTIEFQARKSADGSAGYDTALTTDTSDGSAVNGWFCELSSVRGFLFAVNGGVVLSHAIDPNDSSWHHWAVFRSGSTLYMSRDGEILTSVSYAPAIPADGDFGIGGSLASASYRFNGYIDEVRITKGVARYTAAFTPPTDPFEGGGGSTSYVLSGNVKDAAGANVARNVEIWRRSPLTHLATVTSDGSTGNYSYTTAFNEPHVLVAFPASGEPLNALVLDRVTPKAVTT